MEGGYSMPCQRHSRHHGSEPSTHRRRSTRAPALSSFTGTAWRSWTASRAMTWWQRMKFRSCHRPTSSELFRCGRQRTRCLSWCLQVTFGSFPASTPRSPQTAPVGTWFTRLTSTRCGVAKTRFSAQSCTFFEPRRQPNASYRTFAEDTKHGQGTRSPQPGTCSSCSAATPTPP